MKSNKILVLDTIFSSRKDSTEVDPYISIHNLLFEDKEVEVLPLRLQAYRRHFGNVVASNMNIIEPINIREDHFFKYLGLNINFYRKIVDNYSFTVDSIFGIHISKHQLSLKDNILVNKSLDRNAEGMKSPFIEQLIVDKVNFIFNTIQLPIEVVTSIKAKELNYDANIHS